jgi:hypothetical protein
MVQGPLLVRGSTSERQPGSLYETCIALFQAIVQSDSLPERECVQLAELTAVRFQLRPIVTLDELQSTARTRAMDLVEGVGLRLALITR